MKKLILIFQFLLTVNFILAQNFSQLDKIVASDRESRDYFGYAVSISGDYAIVGASDEDEDASGSNTLSGSGSAYIFKNNGGTWSQVQKIVASDRDSLDSFGISVSISGDYAIVGADDEDEDASGSNTLSGAGSAYIFKNNGGTWSQVQKIVASDRDSLDSFGRSVSISGDYVIVGAYHEEEDASGSNTLSGAGSAYIFKNNGGTWNQIQKIVASDREARDLFGYTVSMSGDYAVIGAYQEDEDTSGLNTLPVAGSAYIFKNNGGTWSQVQKIVASERESFDYFGYTVSISGDYAVVGAYAEDEDASGSNTLSSAGSAYIFENNGGTWSQVQKIVASDREFSDNFGFSVSISGDYAIVGAVNEEEDASGSNTLSGAGSAYIFKNTAGTWSQVQKIVASDRDSDDSFGGRVSISGDYAIAGAYFEEEDASGLNTLSSAGSAYIFGRTNSAPRASNKTVSINEDNMLTLTPSDFGYYDDDGDLLANIEISTIPNNGTLFKDDNTNGRVDPGEILAANDQLTKAELDGSKLKFTPNFNESGSPYTTFDFRVNDGRIYSESIYTITINVKGINDPPSFLLTPVFELEEDAQYRNRVLILKQIIHDPDNSLSELSYSWTKSENIEISLDLAKDTIEIKLKENWFGKDTLEITVSDGEYMISSPVYVTVNSINDLPVIEGLEDFYDLCGEDSLRLDLWGMTTDVETPDSSLTFEFTASSDTLSFDYNASTGIVTLKTPGTYEGDIDFTIKVSDTDGGETEGESVYSTCLITGMESFAGKIPKDYTLENNYPNPFNPTTIIRFGLPSNSQVDLRVYNILGELVAKIKDEIMQAGYHEVKWGTGSMASGVYIYTMYAESINSEKSFSSVKKMLMVK